jgi:hypothetical protein
MISDPHYKSHQVSSWAGLLTVGWETKITYLLSPSDTTNYRYSCRNGVANARSDINYAISQLELRLAHAREADSILREIEDWEAQDANQD